MIATSKLLHIHISKAIFYPSGINSSQVMARYTLDAPPSPTRFIPYAIIYVMAQYVIYASVRRAFWFW